MMYGIIALVIFVTMLILKTRKPQLWTRVTDAEATLWRRLGVPSHQVDVMRRVEHSQGFGIFLWVMITVSGFVTISSIVLMRLFPAR